MRLPCALLALACVVRAASPSGTLVQLPGSPFPAGASPCCIAVADFNSDGKLDLAVANRIPFGGTVTLLFGNGAGAFTAGSILSAGDAPWAIATADFNGDGAADLAVANFNSGNVTVLL